ncbi:hypothetical protein IP87_01280 [beta proteobacterium AAP121]|nr:hypothetical protein IP80_04945 [beta proteobacterium AAP65]KPG00793.1 hypothetical protein IP87_01280 [beta proteobacterium AAP121]
MKLRALCGAALLATAASVSAAPIFGGFDLATFNFDITSYNVGSNAAGLGGNATASGTSNGIGWSISPTNLWTGRTTTNGTYAFQGLPVLTDNLHASANFTITFAQTIDKLVVALGNDAGADSINFGIAPTAVQGLTVTGTQINLTNARGAFALFENINSLTVSHTNTNGLDGFDLAFHAMTAPVPEPGSLALAGLALAGLAASRRRRSR